MRAVQSLLFNTFEESVTDVTILARKVQFPFEQYANEAKYADPRKARLIVFSGVCGCDSTIRTVIVFVRRS
jgi:midasin (ATPase involved in ribosome maturation)